MRLKYLFFCAIFFSFLNSYKTVLTQNNDIFFETNEFVNKFVASELCEFITSEYATDKYPKINILLKNKAFKKKHAHKKFWTKIKNSYFILKSTGVIAIIIVVLYFLYLLYEWLEIETLDDTKEIPDNTETIQDDNEETQDCIEENPYNPKNQDRTEKDKSCIEKIQDDNNGETKEPEDAQSTKTQQTQYDELTAYMQEPKCIWPQIDPKLNNSILKQITQAKELKIATTVIPEIKPIDAELIKTELRYLYTRIHEQIEYVKKMADTN